MQEFNFNRRFRQATGMPILNISKLETLLVLIWFFCFSGETIAQNMNEQVFESSANLSGYSLSLSLDAGQTLITAACAEITSANSFQVRISWNTVCAPSGPMEIGTLILTDEMGNPIGHGRVSWGGGAILVDLVDF